MALIEPEVTLAAMRSDAELAHRPKALTASSFCAAPCAGCLRKKAYGHIHLAELGWAYG